MDGMGEGIGPTDITDLGHEVFQIDTRMAGYDGITAGVPDPGRPAVPGGNRDRAVRAGGP